MERRKRKSIPDKNSGKRVRENVQADVLEIHQTSNISHQTFVINHQKSSIYNSCPHCAGIPFETIIGLCEDRICPDCEHKKTAWLIQKYQADEEARKKKKFAPIEPERKRKHIRTNFLSK